MVPGAGIETHTSLAGLRIVGANSLYQNRTNCDSRPTTVPPTATEDHPSITGAGIAAGAAPLCERLTTEGRLGVEIRLGALKQPFKPLAVRGETKVATPSFSPAEPASCGRIRP